MSPTIIGIMGTAGTVLAALIGALVMLLLARRAEQRAEDAEERQRDAEARAHEPEHWSIYAQELRADIARLTVERDQERARADLLKARLDEQ